MNSEVSIVYAETGYAKELQNSWHTSNSIQNSFKDKFSFNQKESSSDLAHSKLLESYLIEQEVMDWFMNKHIVIGNPEDIVCQHKRAQRKSTNLKLKQEISLKSKSPPSILAKRNLKKEIFVNV